MKGMAVIWLLCAFTGGKLTDNVISSALQRRLMKGKFVFAIGLCFEDDLDQDEVVLGPCLID
jgi:hypothetical protein